MLETKRAGTLRWGARAWLFEAFGRQTQGSTWDSSCFAQRGHTRDNIGTSVPTGTCYPETAAAQKRRWVVQAGAAHTPVLAAGRPRIRLYKTYADTAFRLG